MGAPMHGWGLGNIKHALIAGALVAGLLATPQAALTATAAAAACANDIACENELPGAPPSEWDISGSGDPDVQGFSTDISVDRGERIDFKVRSTTPYTIRIYRTGYYQGLGARLVQALPGTIQPQSQPPCINDVTTDLLDCGNWDVSASWDVPASAVSGVYIAVLNRQGGGASHITFIVRDDTSHSDLVFQTSDTTWQAYNRFGADFYGGGTHGSPARAYKISYNRPMVTRGAVPWGRDYYFANEFPLVRFLERNGYDVSYIAGPDTDRRGDLLRNHRTFLSVGHDEYWSGRQRANVEAARDAGVNLMFLSGNEMYWRVRWEPSIDGSSTSYRTLTSYKETWQFGKVDPSAEWTGTFRDPRYASQANGAGLPENAVTGTIFKANHDDLALTVDAREGRLRLWRNTSLAGLPAGESRQLTPSTVGYESDEDLDNGFRPPGLIRLSTTVGPTPQYVHGFGNLEEPTYIRPGTTTHHLTMYRAASGALVFGAGTVQWTWGLDDTHDAPGTPPPADDRMQQAQVNLLADMGAQPTTLMPTLTPASASTDTVGPTVAITSGAAGQQANGDRVTIEGTATDAGGGEVAGVEVSTDRGATWHPATGTTSWSYTYTQHGYGARAVRVRAVDDSANIGPARTRHPDVACPCSIFGDEVPETPADSDTSASHLGLRFVPTRDGQVTGVRFYKGPGNDGVHVGRLWSATGVELAQATFSAESATGWQQVSFASPVAVQAGQTYVVSYTAPQGRYAVLSDAFELAGIEADPLSVPGGFAGGESGVYANSPTGFPDQSFRNTNYYVDVLFQPSGAPDGAPTLAVTDRQPAPGATGVATNASVTVGFSAPVEPGHSFTLRSGGSPVAGSVSSSEGGRRLTFTPSAALPALAQVTVDLAGVTSDDGVDLEPLSWTFTTAAGPATPPGTPGTPGTPGNPGDTGNPGDPAHPAQGLRSATLFGGTKPTSRPSARRGTEVGVQFSATRDGTVTALRYFQVRGTPAPRSVSLWSSNGTRLAKVTLPRAGSRPTKGGWRVIEVDAPVALSEGRSYVASYYLPAGGAARTTHFYKTQVWKSGPLRAARAGNGRFVIAGRSRFPRRVARGVNFFADVRFVFQDR
ncbi:N,N-dimethylformamidase beta subunit family domain-containing protein [Nocardioides currus]|uniref:DUF4082 domain-containing protein n=1 Tax=Nocardioides currus TaxID=2133958 RepID=A0A2R7YV72_9ACTN|nr:N,N-dimethylformamidase beta subunit family domain-containing protein [Nocardioides currus]PUA79779.1 hypothetical protein C7S10_17005 [Nocardioides currus]